MDHPGFLEKLAPESADILLGELSDIFCVPAVSTCGAPVPSAMKTMSMFHVKQILPFRGQSFGGVAGQDATLP